MVAVLDQAGRIVRINESAANFIGRSVQELLGTLALTHLENEEIERIAKDVFQRVLAGEVQSFEMEGPVEIDGKRRSAVWSTNCIREGEVRSWSERGWTRLTDGLRRMIWRGIKTISKRSCASEATNSRSLSVDWSMPSASRPWAL
jgi:PAS domain S-box-containing protein